MKVTATSHAMTGNYQSLKQAHLKHDEEKYNSNKDIRYDKKHLNTHHVHVEDFDAFYEEKYEGPIKEYNAKQKRKDRKIDDYDTYLEQKKNNKNRNKERPHDPNRIFLMNFSNMEDNEKIKKHLMDRLGITEDEYLALMASGMDLAVERFNERYGHCMTITEHFTHVNEASPHAHCNLWAHGTDKFGKPYTDINDSLKELYAGTKERDGKTVRKNLKDYWKDFRDEVDTIILKSVEDKIYEKYREKGINKKIPMELHRKDSDIVGLSGEVYKEVHRQADDMLDKKKRDLEMQVLESEEKVESRKRALDSVSAEFKERSSKKWDELESWEERLEAKEVQLETKEARIDQYVRENMDKVKDDTLVGRAWRRAAQKDPKRMASYNRVLKAEKEYAMGRNLQKTGREGFDLDR